MYNTGARWSYAYKRAPRVLPWGARATVASTKAVIAFVGIKRGKKKKVLTGRLHTYRMVCGQQLEHCMLRTGYI